MAEEPTIWFTVGVRPKGSRSRVHPIVARFYDLATAEDYAMFMQRNGYSVEILTYQRGERVMRQNYQLNGTIRVDGEYYSRAWDFVSRKR